MQKVNISHIKMVKMKNLMHMLNLTLQYFFCRLATGTFPIWTVTVTSPVAKVGNIKLTHPCTYIINNTMDMATVIIVADHYISSLF